MSVMLMSTNVWMLVTASQTAGCVTETATAKMVQMNLTAVSHHLKR